MPAAAIPKAALLVWAALVWASYWPGFRFPLDWSWRAFVPASAGLEIGGFLEALGFHLKHAVLAALVLTAARGAGLRLCSVTSIRAPALVASVPAGLAILGAAFLGLGLAGLLKPGILFAFLAAGALGNGGFCRFAIRPRGYLAAGLAAAATAVAALPAALVPEITYDALAYHLGAPELYLKAGRIIRADGMFFTDLPLALQMIYMAPVSLGAGGAAKLIHWSLGVGCLGQAAILGTLVGGISAGRWSMAFLAATPLLAAQMMRANVDLGVVFMTGAGIYWLARESKRGWVMAALCLGASSAVKLTGAYGVAAGLAVVSLRRFSFSPVWAAAAALPLVPWLARSFLSTGNPFYPFLWDTLGGLGWSAESEAMYRQDMTGPTSFNIQYPLALDRLAGPWVQVMHDVGGLSALGPFVLSVLPALAWRAKGLPRAAGTIARFSLFYWLAWFLTARDPRFFLPAWPAACVLAAVLFCRVKEGTGRAALPALNVVFGAAVAFTPFFVAGQAYRLFHPGPVAWGAVTRSFYEDVLVPPGGKFKPFLRLADQVVPGGERILVVGDVKAPGCGSSVLYPSMFDEPHIVSWLKGCVDASRLRVRFRQKKVGCVFYNEGGAIFLRDHFGHFGFNEPQRRILREFWGSYLEPVRGIGEKSSRIVVYLVRSRPGPRGEAVIPGETP